MKKFVFLLLFIVGIGLVGCKKVIPTITLQESDKNIALIVGEEKEIKLIVHNKFTVEWSSEKPNVATVDNGKIKAVGIGATNIIVKIKDEDVQEIIKVIVGYSEPQSIAVTGEDKVTVDETISLKAIITPATAEQKINWKSSDTAIATIDSAGKVTGIKDGTVTITACAAKDEKIKDIKLITVVLKEPTSIQIVGKDVLNIDDVTTYTITTTPLGANQKVEWEVSDTTIALIDNEGKVTALKSGTFTITAKAINNEEVLATKMVRVKFTDPTEITVIGEEFANVNDEIIFTATVIPEDANQNVIWSVSNQAIATIDSNGKLTALKGGEVLITATSPDLNTIKKVITLTVYDMPSKVSYRGPELFVIDGSGLVYCEIEGVNKLLVDESQINYSVDNPEILTIDSKTGKVKALKAGKCNITITSTIDSNIKVSKEVTVNDESTTYDLTKVLVSSQFENKESFYSTYDYKTHIIGYDAFDSVEAALAKVSTGATIVLTEDTYTEIITINKNNITITALGKVIYQGVINIAKDVDGLTIDGLEFTDTGCVVGSLEAGIKNFTFKNNHIYDPNTTDLSVLNFHVTDAEKFNSNFIIINNVFEVIDLEKIDNRYIRGGNITNIRIVGNVFKGLKGHYTDAIRLGGNGENAAESNTTGIGVAGELIITNNEFINIGQRAIWIRRYSAFSIIIEDNHFNYAGDQSFGGAVQLQTWAANGKTDIQIRFNTFVNILGSFGVRINNENATSDWTANVNYNKFELCNTSHKYIEGYNDTYLINGENNYYSSMLEALFSKVKDYAIAYDNEADYDLSVALVKGDPTYGVVMFDENLETHDNISYTDTLTTFNGLEWKLKEVYLNPDNNDKVSATNAQGDKMLRLRGANTAYIELKEFFDGITTFAFDAKYYNTSHAAAVLKVSKMVKDAWIDVETITLTDKYTTYYVDINETGKVKVRIDVTNKSANIDNLCFFHSEELAKATYKLISLKSGVVKLLDGKTGEYSGVAVGTKIDEHLRDHGLSGYTITHGDNVFFVGYKAYIELREMTEEEAVLPWQVVQPHTTGDNALNNYGISLSGPVAASGPSDPLYGTGAMYHNRTNKNVIVNSKELYGYQGTAWGYDNYYGVILVDKDGLIKKNYSGAELEAGLNITLASGDYVITTFQGDRNALGNKGYHAHSDFAEGNIIKIAYNPNLTYGG